MSTSKGMDKHVEYIYNEIILSDKKNKIMLFAAIQMDLGIGILSDVGETDKTKYMILFICVVFKKQYKCTYLQTEIEAQMSKTNISERKGEKGQTRK